MAFMQGQTRTSLVPVTAAAPRLSRWPLLFCPSESCGEGTRPLTRVRPGFKLSRQPHPVWSTIKLQCRSCHAEWYVVPNGWTG
jgi:hypothetical protein